MITKRCKICGRPFQTMNRRYRICSKICLKKERKRINKNWSARNKDLIKQAQHRYHLNNPYRHIEYYDKIKYALKEKNRLIEIKKPGFFREKNCLITAFGTTQINHEVRKIYAVFQLFKRVLDGKINRAQVPQRIKLIQQGATHYGYK